MLSVPPAILISDDDVGFRETVRDVFSPRGYRTLMAGDGQEALEIALSQDIHLALLDMHMPKLTGLETLRRLKQVKVLLPCILLSADLDEALVQQALLAQAFSVLAKPISSRQLTSTVQQAMQRAYNWP